MQMLQQQSDGGEGEGVGRGGGEGAAVKTDMWNVKMSISDFPLRSVSPALRRQFTTQKEK